MRALSGADFLQLWENGSSLHPVDQGLLALLAGHPETSYEALADWPLGRRNQALAELRCSCFGSRIEGWVACPRCAEKLEFEIDARELAGAGERREVLVVNGKSYRLPTSRDLARVAREPDEDSAAARLLEYCRLEGGAPA